MVFLGIKKEDNMSAEPVIEDKVVTETPSMEPQPETEDSNLKTTVEVQPDSTDNEQDNTTTTESTNAETSAETPVESTEDDAADETESESVPAVREKAKKRTRAENSVPSTGSGRVVKVPRSVNEQTDKSEETKQVPKKKKKKVQIEVPKQKNSVKKSMLFVPEKKKSTKKLTKVIESEAEVSGEAGKIRKKHRFKPGTVALRAIKKNQKRIKWQLPHTVFKRVLRQVMHEEGRYDLRFRRMAVNSLHDLLESDIIDVLVTSNILSIHRGNKSIREPDFKMALNFKRIQRLSDPEPKS